MALDRDHDYEIPSRAVLIAGFSFPRNPLNMAIFDSGRDVNGD